MGYQIEYPECADRRRRHSRLRAPFRILLCVLVLMGLCWKDSRYYIRRLLFPGDAAAALAELERLAGNLQGGKPLGQALEAFCVGIVSR